ncbi:MAG: hypothetical protein VX642_11175 [Bdellovibrionota bacterium]|nr:hypothetical protein [Bdellovibrionota bacterium]
MKELDLIIDHLILLGQGECKITESQVNSEADESMKQILAGILHLHEDIEYKEKLIVEQEKLRYVKEWINQLGHEINNPLTVVNMIVQKNDDFKDREKALVALDRIAEIVRKMEEIFRMTNSQEAIEEFYITGNRIKGKIGS